MSTPAPLQGAEPVLPVDGFLKTVLRSGLIAAPLLQSALKPVPAEHLGDARYLANYLVKIGKLSRFQASKLLQGVTKGLVLGPYHVLAPIGKGGMGAVYLARDTRTQTLAAVKVLPPKRAKAEERLLARFKREMDICQKVAHPNVARTFEVGQHEDVNYIAMEYIAGKNLYRLVTDEGALPAPRAARLFQEICLGLEHAHAQGLIHRDMKPSNVVITPDDHAKVLDLGLALMQGEAQADRTVVGGQGYIVGTLDYLAPEQADDAFTVDIRSDIYSLGCTLYFALTRQPPFPGGNALQKLLRHRVDAPPSVLHLNPAVPPELAALVERMMAKKKEERFASAAEVRVALQAWVPQAADPIARPAPAAPVTEIPKPPPAAAPPPPSSTASFVARKGSDTMKPALAAGIARQSKETASWPREHKPADLAPQALPLPQEPGDALPEAAPLAVLLPPTPETPPTPAGEIPFWLDYLVPACGGAAFLLLVWLLGLTWLLR